MKRTKIICTIGPASESQEKIDALVAAGMNIARLNFSHGTYTNHATLLRRLRAAEKKSGQPIGVLQDLQGPKIRVGELPKEGVELRIGKTVIFSTGPLDAKKIPVGYPHLHRDVKKGDHLLLDDGLMEVEVVSVTGRDIIVNVLFGGVLTSHKGINVPTASLSVSAISEKDKLDLDFGVKVGVDMIALSFVRSPADVRQLRRLIAAAEVRHKKTKTAPILVIAKIEKHEALECFDAILAEVDGIMVARGDLGIETPAAEVPLWQKTIIQKCLAAAKPVIVATQMLDSMIRNPRATRAEISDIANAVIDHTDAIMLSGESASGKYPIEATRTMATVVQETEASFFDNLHIHASPGSRLNAEEAIGKTAGVLARSLHAKAIVASSMTGETARQISRFRPEMPVFCGAIEDRIVRQMNLSWGVRPFRVPAVKNEALLMNTLFTMLKKHRALKKGDTVIYISGILGKKGETNQITIEKVG